MDEQGAVAGVFAVVAGVMMASGDIDGALVDVRIKQRARPGHRRSGLGGLGTCRAARNHRPGVAEASRRHGNGGWCRMAGVMDEAGKGQGVAPTAALMIDPKRIGAGCRRRNAILDQEGIGGSKAGNDEPIFARCGEA